MEFGFLLFVESMFSNLRRIFEFTLDAFVGIVDGDGIGDISGVAITISSTGTTQQTLLRLFRKIRFTFSHTDTRNLFA